MVYIKYNTKPFNKYIKLNYEGLKAHNECCGDIVVNLLKGYIVVSNNESQKDVVNTKYEYYGEAGLRDDKLVTLV